MSAGPTIALVAGEASGDLLGGSLISALRRRLPDARFCGIGGETMRQAGMETWWDSDELALFGLFEVLGHLPRLVRLRRELRARLLRARPDVFVGIDAPDFNLGLESQLRRRGLRTVHYVSPTVWAWRPGRVRTIAAAADHVLCLFPFEPAFYDQHGVPATFVGHPLADRIDPVDDPSPAREELDLPADGGPVVALLPGSRVSEVSRLAPPMIGAAERLSRQFEGIRFVAALAGERVRGVFEQAIERFGAAPEILRVNGRSTTVIAAADAVLCASGTVTLETLLINRPMVTAYRLAPATYHVARHLRLVRPQHFALPNILAGETLVPELIQHEATAERLARETRRWLTDEHARERLRERFASLGGSLRRGASDRAAETLVALMGGQ